MLRIRYHRHIGGFTTSRKHNQENVVVKQHRVVMQQPTSTTRIKADKSRWNGWIEWTKWNVQFENLFFYVCKYRIQERYSVKWYHCVGNMRNVCRLIVRFVFSVYVYDRFSCYFEVKTYIRTWRFLHTFMYFHIHTYRLRHFPVCV